MTLDGCPLYKDTAVSFAGRTKYKVNDLVWPTLLLLFFTPSAHS